MLCAFAATRARAQTKCLTPEQIQQFTAQIEANTARPFNKKLNEQLNKLAAKQQERVQNNVAENKSSDTILKNLRTARDANTEELCSILKQYGWPTRDLVGEDGEHSVFFLLRNSATDALQRELLPVIIAAVKKGEISKGSFATYIDRLRTNAGLKQIFGTQATIRDGFLMLYPIADEQHVDARRKQYDMPPLNIYLRGLEQLYRLPLIKATGTLANSFSDNSQASIANATDKVLSGTTEDDVDVVRVDTNLVSLNVSVYSTKLRTEVAQLEQKDFTVSEDGKPQEISFFATTAVPFDLVLLLDLSGSTADKRDLIRKSTKRFIEAARPADRIAIVAFADDFWIVCPLTADRTRLLAGANQIEGGGGSRVWDALAYTLDTVFDSASSPRRRAVVFMTDGVDNALGSYGGNGIGSKISFADLLESVRHHDALVVPIYLDTEHDRGYFADADRRTYTNARNTLGMLAFESGGLYYSARKVEDLNGVYEQVIEDLSKVYSIGYRSSNEKRDGSWRTVDIGIAGHPDLKTRTRPGYYAK